MDEKDVRESLKDIIIEIGVPAILEQLAEECAELGKASLKLSRIIRGENPTPVTNQEAFNELVEEIADVRLLFRILETIYDGIPTKYIEEYKLQRWKKRINECERDCDGRKRC